MRNWNVTSPKRVLLSVEKVMVSAASVKYIKVMASACSANRSQIGNGRHFTHKSVLILFIEWIYTVQMLEAKSVLFFVWSTSTEYESGTLVVLWARNVVTIPSLDRYVATFSQRCMMSTLLCWRKEAWQVLSHFHLFFVFVLRALLCCYCFYENCFLKLINKTFLCQIMVLYGNNISEPVEEVASLLFVFV